MARCWLRFLALSALALNLPARAEDAQTPAAEPVVQDATWVGLTGQNKPYKLRTQGNQVTQIVIDYTVGGCSGSMTVNGSFPIDSGNSFSASAGFCPSFTTGGTFNPSAQTASGTLNLSATPIPGACSCSGSVSTTWSAGTPTIVVGDVSVAEGDGGTTSAVFTVSLTSPSGITATVDYATGGGTATFGGDYVGNTGTLTFPPGVTSQTVAVSILGDVVDEPNETFFLALSGATGAGIEDASGQGTIVDDDAVPTVSIDDRTVAEGAAVNAAFRLSLSSPSGQAVTVQYATADVSAKGGPIPTAFDSSGGLTLPGSPTPQGPATPYPSTIDASSFPGAVEKVTVTLSGITHTKPDELDVLLVGPGGQSVILMSDVGLFGPASNVTLTFDDAASASLSSSALTNGTYKPTDLETGDSFAGPAPGGPYGNALSVFNGQAGSGTWSLYVMDDGPFGFSGGTISGWTLRLFGSTGADYVATAGTLTFTPGRTNHSIFVPVITDGLAEGDETFTVTLTSPTNALLARDVATGTITDPPVPAKVAMYRAYNRNADYHFFTTDLASKNFAVGVLGYQDESSPVPFYVLNTREPGSVPLFRMYNPNLGRHYYTADTPSRDSLMGIGMIYEKDEGFCHPLGVTPPAGATELFRLYNNNSGTHLFTADAGQKDFILATFPGVWVVNSSVGYVFASP